MSKGIDINRNRIPADETTSYASWSLPTIRDGKIIQSWKDRDITSFTTIEPGVYRIEVFIPFHGKRRGWIYSNPIYIR